MVLQEVTSHSGVTGGNQPQWWYRCPTIVVVQGVTSHSGDVATAMVADS